MKVSTGIHRQLRLERASRQSRALRTSLILCNLGGWSYYYLYAMGVKMPVGTLFLLALTCVMKIWGLGRVDRGRALRCASRLNVSDDPLTTHDSPLTPIPAPYDEVVLLAPPILLIVLVSSQTGFNRYLRYVVPAFPFLYIWISQLAMIRRS